jgi:hypothetical protein
MAGHAYFDEESVPLPQMMVKNSPKPGSNDKYKKSKIEKAGKVKKSDSSSQGILVEFCVGEVSIGLSDSRGVVLSEMGIRVSGGPEAKGGLVLPLSLKTDEGEVEVTPTLISCSCPEQSVLFDNIEPSDYIRARAREIDCSKTVRAKLERGKVKQRLSPDFFLIPLLER